MAQAVFIVERQYWIDATSGTSFADGSQRIISFQSRSPVFDTVAERVLGPRLAISLTVQAVNDIGDGLDPRIRGLW